MLQDLPQKLPQELRKKSLENCIYGIAAILVFVLLFCFTYKDRENRQEKQAYEVVILGDSITGSVRDETSVAARLSELVGTPVFNGALGGTCMARIDVEKRLDYNKDSLSMAGLAKAIVSKDFGVQQTTRIREGATEYFGETIDALERVDFEKVQVLFIGHGLNDYHGGVKLYAGEQNPYDEDTYIGALRSVVTSLQKAYPRLRIILLTPTYSWYFYTGQTCEELDAGYGVLENFVEAEKQAAAELGVEIIDLYHNFYPHEVWEDLYVYTDDGLHPNEEARLMIAEKMAACLQGE